MADHKESKSVLFFSSDDWESGLKTSKYHMACCLAADGYTVLYVNSIGLRQPRFSTGIVRKIIGRLRGIFRGVRCVQENIYVLTPFVIPFHRHAIVNRMNRFLLVMTVRWYQWRLGLRRPELWVFLPNHADVIGAFGERLSLYYCVDEHTLFEGVDVNTMRSLESRLIRGVDLLVVTARSLYASKGPQAKSVLYLPHGVDVGHFRQALDPKTPIPADIAALPHPVVGFFGLIEEWIDLDMIALAARQHPRWSFVMLGKSAVDLTAFSGIRNLHFLGPKSFADLPAYCKVFDCAMLPFKITDMTIHVNPLKMREYLAAGLRVVSTDLPEVRDYAPPILIARNREEFAVEIERALSQPLDRASTTRLMDDDSWEGRYRTLRAEIERRVIANDQR